MTAALAAEKNAGTELVRFGTETGQKADRVQVAAKSHVKEWSSRWGWVERTLNWDDYLDSFVRRRAVKTVEAMAERHAKQAQQALALLMVPLVEFAKASQTPARNPMAHMWSDDLLAHALEAAKIIPKMQEAERAASGVRVKTNEDRESGFTGPTDWLVTEFQPERKVPLPDFSLGEEKSAPDDWEKSPGHRDDE